MRICIFILFQVGSGRVGSGRVDGNSDNGANSAQFQMKLPTGAELGKNNRINSGHFVLQPRRQAANALCSDQFQGNDETGQDEINSHDETENDQLVLFHYLHPKCNLARLEAPVCINTQ